MKANRAGDRDQYILIYAASIMGLLTAGFISLPVFLQRFYDENSLLNERYFTALFQASLFASGLTGVATLEIMRKVAEKDGNDIENGSGMSFDNRILSETTILDKYHQHERRLNISTEDDLRSEKGVDYTKLRDLLKAGEWEEADRETDRVMLEVVGRKANVYIRKEEMEQFPCTDLLTIDQLWVKYSKGRFGFSVQKKIYVETGNPLDGEYHEKEFRRFSKRVGWWLSESGRFVRGNAFSTSAPEGHLPSFPWSPFWSQEDGLSVLFSRAETCQL